MKTKLLSLALLLIYQVSVSGCNVRGAGNISSEARTLEKFTGVELKNFANVNITQGNTQGVTIEGDKNILPHIITTVVNDILVISSDDDFNTNEIITVNITVKDINSVELSGSGNITLQNQVKTENMSMRISGSGDIHAWLDAKQLKMALSGSGNMDIKGNAQESNIKISGSGNVNGKELETFTSSITITGSGTSIVDVNNDLTVTITGSGNVFYISDPERIHSKINGSGRIEKIS